MSRTTKIKPTVIPTNLDDLDKLTPDERMALLWAIAQDAVNGRLKDLKHAKRVTTRIQRLEREYYRARSLA